MTFIQGIAASPWAELAIAALRNGLRWSLSFLAVYALYHWLRLHQRFGFFKTQEPKSHFRSMLKSWKIPFIWGVGFTIVAHLMGLGFTASVPSAPQLLWAPPPEWVILPRAGLWSDLAYAVLGFYLMDFVDYWSHRLNHHYSHLYRRFPYGHFVHHNCVFLTPMSVPSAPPVQLALIATWLVYIAMLSQGLLLSVVIMHLVRLAAAVIAHLGFDPLPALSRLNHRVGGWIPWMPLHHQYHHLPNVGFGNYGNITCLWDYTFGTVVPECAYHLEHGRATPEVQRFFDNAEAELAVFFKDRGGLNLPLAAAQLPTRDIDQTRAAGYR